MSIRIAVLGASGAVGREMINLLEKRQFPLSELRLLASPRSAGTKIPFRGKLLTVQEVTPESFEGIDIAIFSAGGGTSKEWAPIAAEKGAIVVDNSSAFRMDADVPLVVPECNPHMLDSKPPRGIIANPNCSTIQMVQVLKPLHEAKKLKRLIISTYQSVSGTGKAAIDELLDQTTAILANEPDEVEIDIYPHQIAFNVIPQIDVFLDNGYTKEEMKMVNETRKILEADDIRVSATCVRVPVIRAHSESINAEFEQKITPEEARELAASVENVIVVDDPQNSDYPLAIYAEGRMETFVGRFRQDISNPEGTSIDMWIVSDNLYKGAALNAIQISELLVKKGTVG